MIASVPGSFQSELGCPGDWQPDCLRSWLQDPDGDGTYAFTTDSLPEGDYEAKVAHDESWDVNYGAGGVADGPNIAFSVPADDVPVSFSYDPATHVLTISVEAGGGPEPGDEELVRRSLRGETDEVFYFVLPDRFANGSTANDTGGLSGGKLAHGYDPADKGFYHGGDMRGLIDRLDYLEGMGVNAIWMAPLFKNRPVQGSGADASAGYHGYWITDFTQLDPHFGTNAELRELVDGAHARGIKVFFDVITNHTADVIDYAEGTYDYVSKAEEPYWDADGLEFDDADYAGSDDFPELNLQSFPLLARLPDRGGRDREGARLAERPHDVPQPRQLDLRGRERALRRLLRPRRPLHRAARGRRGDDRHLLGLGHRRRHRRLPDRHGQARQRRVLAGVGARARAARRERGHRRLLHVRRGLRLESRLHVALHEGREAPGRARLPLPEQGPLLRVRILDDRARGAVRRRRPTTPTPTRTPTACRPSSATTTWAGSATSSAPTIPAPRTRSCSPATSSRTR